MRKFIEKKFNGEHIWNAYIDEADDDNPLEKFDEEAWKDDGKYSCKDVVFKEKSTGHFYCYGLSRTGSYYSDYYYPLKEDCLDRMEPCTRVEQAEKTVKYWKSMEAEEQK